MKSKLRGFPLLFVLFTSQVCTVPLNTNERKRGRILGGNDTDIADIPYQVAVEGDDLLPFCGGTVITSHHVVTAAHCLENHQTSDIFVRAGSSKAGEGGVRVSSKKFYIHPNFNTIYTNYDVAVIELENPLNFSCKIQPIGLTDVEPRPGTLGLVSGWGDTDLENSSPEILQSVFVPVVDRGICRKILATFNITDQMICAGGIRGEDSCIGDSGGPLQIDRKLVGITSFGSSCGGHTVPGVYTNVADLSIHKFIKNFIDSQYNL